MRGLPLFFCFFFLIIHSRAFSEEKPASPGLRFTRNDGQWEKSVLYRAALPGGFLFVKKQSLQYVFYDTRAVASHHPDGHAADGSAARTSLAAPAADPDMIQAHGFEVQFGGSAANAILLPSEQTPERRNFMLGNNSAEWAANVPSFSQLLYRNIYPGIDLRLFVQNGTAKYEFIVQPGANPAQIRLVYNGMSDLSLKDGFLVTTTTVNTVTETPPYSYQQGNGGQQEVASRYVLRGNVLTFAFPDGYRRDAPLVIDPYLVFSTYSGSFTDNWGFTATYDEAGNLYSGGIDFGSRFPATTGAFQVRFSGQTDVAILKYNPEGTGLLYATYIGGGGTDIPHSLIINKADELIIFGTTASVNFPTTQGAYDRTFNGGAFVDPLNSNPNVGGGGISYLTGSDLFVSRINATGSTLAASTYIGGSRNDGLNVNAESTIKNYGDQFRGDVNVDDAGNIYVASTTISSDFPTVNAPQAKLSGSQDAVIFQLNAGLSSLLWSTYYGGSGFDAARGLRLGASGAVYVCGGTTSPDLTTSPGVLKPAMTDTEDGFVAKFSLGNAQPLLSYIGTNNRDQTYLVDLDGAENVYVTGLTYGPYPVTPGTYSKGTTGQFIHAMNNTFTQTIFSTVVSSGRTTPDISPTAFMISDCGFIYLTGWGGAINNQRGITGSSTNGLPVTADALRGTTNGDDYYLVILGANAGSLLYGTFFGSPGGDNHVDGGTSRFRKDGTIYHAVCACRDNSSFPTTPGAWSRVNNGDAASSPGANDGCNNAAFKFALNTLVAGFDGDPEICTSIPTTFSNTSQGASTAQWEVNGQVVSSNNGPLSYSFTQPGEYTVTQRVFNPATCKQTDAISKKITVKQATPVSVDQVPRICFGASTRLRASGGVKYEWSPATGLDNPASATPVATPARTTEYRVRITNSFGCVQELRTRVEVNSEVRADFDVIVSSECGKPNRVRLVNKSQNARRYQWLTGNGGGPDTSENPEEYEYLQPGEYEITLNSSDDECGTTTTKRIRVEDPKDPPNVITPNGDKRNELFILPNPGWKLEVYDRWGKPVYASESYQNDWGDDVRAGVYYYRITSPLGASCKGWLHVLK